MPDPAVTPTIDGRRLRGKRSRQGIVEAMIELVRSGNPEPTAEEVAARAGVAMRTVFRHFADMDSLYREISQKIQRQRSRFSTPKSRAEPGANNSTT